MSDSINLPLFDGASVALLSDLAAMSSAAGEALHRLEQLTPADRLSVTPHVYAYYLDMLSHADTSWVDEAMPRPAKPDDIWQHVRPLSVIIKSRPVTSGVTTKADLQFYVVLEANCDWEDEHGLLLSWRGGHELVKVGDYDDKPVHADHVPAGVIYHSAYDDSFSTYSMP